ncbi:2-phosphosulfolactate phosphatase [Dyadobacter fermentans]|uniref:Probable 2-phosphosulfolactate phosphatase n=1 Tax=Dyadobacter fermentans (strain ATCC 700827 / DSM 18053 / CIP 107007 / KCTC 52180 / NS114) TaxID=471854 RepID=C6W3Q2_DYAFD|nr:2-phosphosulfolactate phosphatase [Dyadobacter fermentans]ACT95750.1 2-phosphosulfolactate phosphatase [Dyadobacter fermentans DSM 18053]
MKQLDVCLTPDLLHLHKLDNSIVVVADIFRATSCMVTGLAYGVKSITPVASVEECKFLQDKGYIAAAERDARKVEGFDLDNSPFSYMHESLIGAQIAMTTTNGTLSISKAKSSAVKVMIGAFLNLGALAEHLKTEPYDVVVLCAGWKGRPNLEDTLFTGALAEALKDEFMLLEDGTLMAQRLYQQSRDNLLASVSNSSHVRRLQRLGIQKDISYCLQTDLYDVVPVLRGGTLVSMN